MLLKAPRVEGFVSVGHIIKELEQQPGGFWPALKRPVVQLPETPRYALDAGTTLEAA